MKIGGVALPETRPIEDMAVLTHWVEFHSPYKGEANAQTRMLFLDLTPQGPVKLALPAALPIAGQTHVEMRIRDTSGMFRPRPTPGILGDLHFDLTPPVYVKDISFDTEKPGDDRRFEFKIVLGNESGQPRHLKLRAVYGRYDGKIAYTGNCPAYATVDQPVDLAARRELRSKSCAMRSRGSTPAGQRFCYWTKLAASSTATASIFTPSLSKSATAAISTSTTSGSCSKGRAARAMLRTSGGNCESWEATPSAVRPIREQINLYQSEGVAHELRRGVIGIG